MGVPIIKTRVFEGLYWGTHKPGADTCIHELGLSAAVEAATCNATHILRTDTGTGWTD